MAFLLQKLGAVGDYKWSVYDSAPPGLVGGNCGEREDARGKRQASSGSLRARNSLSGSAYQISGFETQWSERPELVDLTETPRRRKKHETRKGKRDVMQVRKIQIVMGE